ncbi:energy transducer TonB, partial [Piscinibacterium candidicorallinum]
PPPPPPPKQVTQAPPPEAPPPVFVPQAEVKPTVPVEAPVVPVTTAPPVAEYKITPPAPPAPPALPSVIRGTGNCSAVPPKPEYPRKALQESVQGTIVIRAQVGANGRLGSPVIHSVSGMSQLQARMFQSVLFSNVAGYACAGEPGQVYEIPFDFKLND